MKVAKGICRTPSCIQKELERRVKMRDRKYVQRSNSTSLGKPSRHASLGRLRVEDCYVF